MHYWMSEYIIPLSLNNKSSQHLVTWNIYFISFIVSGIRSLWWDWLHCWPQILKQSTEATGSSLKMAAWLTSQGLRALWSLCVCACVCMCIHVSLSHALSLSTPLHWHLILQWISTCCHITAVQGHCIPQQLASKKMHTKYKCP